MTGGLHRGRKINATTTAGGILRRAFLASLAIFFFQLKFFVNGFLLVILFLTSQGHNQIAKELVGASGEDLLLLHSVQIVNIGDLIISQVLFTLSLGQNI